MLADVLNHIQPLGVLRQIDHPSVAPHPDTGNHVQAGVMSSGMSAEPCTVVFGKLRQPRERICCEDRSVGLCMNAVVGGEGPTSRNCGDVAALREACGQRR